MYKTLKLKEPNSKNPTFIWGEVYVFGGGQDARYETYANEVPTLYIYLDYLQKHADLSKFDIVDVKIVEI